MKKLLRQVTFNFLGLLAAAHLLSGFTYQGGLKTLLFSAVVLAFLNRLVKPLIKLFLLPINLLTLGLFRWLANVINLFLLSLIVKEIGFQPALFPGFHYHGFVVPPLSLSRFWITVLTSFVLSITLTFLNWLSR